jgi:ATP-dependent DNA helicase RecG
LGVQPKQVGEQVSEQVGEQVSEQVAKVLTACKTQPRTKAELLEVLGLANVYMNYKRHLLPLIEQGFIEMTIPEKPKSRLQKYRLTEKGKGIQKKGGL